MQNSNPAPFDLRTVERQLVRSYQGPETSRKRVRTGGPNLVPAELRTVERPAAERARPGDGLAPLHARPPDAGTDPHNEGL